MPTTSRYVLNEMQQATLDVMAANVMPGDDEDLTLAAMTRHEIISAVQLVPGMDEVNGNHMGPCLNCLKRRGLVAEISWPAKGKFHITAMGITYVDLDGEPEPKVSPEEPENLEARPANQAPTAGASSTACDDQHRPEPAEQETEIEADLLATRDAVAGMEKALEELDDARPGPADPGMPAPAGAPEVTILSVAVHPPGTAWLDHDSTVLIKLMDEGSGPYLDISSWDGPAAIESLEMLEAVTNTARNLLREAEAREVAQ